MIGGPGLGCKRAVGTSYSRPGGGGASGAPPAFSETLAWSPRNLKVETTRADLGGRGLLLAYDGAGRVTAADSVPSPQTANNTTPAGGTGTGFAFAYDAAENLLSRSRSTGLGTETSPLPLDGSGRNRPGSLGAGDGQSLAYDANGNLIQKGNRRYHYDYRNRMARVSDATTGATVATYLYDNFNRRLAKTVETAEGPKTTETVWGGWQNLEEYVSDGTPGSSAPQLASRRTYGLGLDEIVRQETDVDGDGVLETVTVPVYDSTGNLVLATGPDGRTLERYEYTPYGGRTIFTDLTGPRLDQLRAVEGPGGGELWLELSEAALPVPLEEAVSADTLTVSVDGAVETLTVSQPVVTGREARRRVVLKLGTTPAAGAAVELTIPGTALVDESGNEATADITQSFTWPGAGSGGSGSSGSVVFDDTDPRVGLVSTYRDGNPVLTVQLSEEADLTAAATAITLDGAPTAWSLEADRYTLTSTASLPAGTHTLAVSTAPLDLAGRGLTEPLELTFTVSSSGAGCAPGTICTSANTPFLYEGLKANQVATSTVGNAHGFHGRPADPETGLVYIRNRYFDPEMGRFVSTDPLGYVDGPSLYGFASYSPFVHSDPFGLENTRAKSALEYADKNRIDPEPFLRRIRVCRVNPLIQDCRGVLSKIASAVLGDPESGVGSPKPLVGVGGGSENGVYVNGIRTDEQGARIQASSAAELANAHLTPVWNPNQSTIRDSLQTYFLHRTGLVDASVARTVEVTRRELKRAGPSMPLRVVGHSQGGALASSALQQLEKTERSRVNLTLVGSAACSLPSGLRSVTTYVNTRDVVPMILGAGNPRCSVAHVAAGSSILYYSFGDFRPDTSVPSAVSAR